MEDQDFKKALSTWASGVTVVVAERDGKTHGMTASSFCSVSLEPRLVLVCVSNRARMMEYFSPEGAFTINILNHSQQAESDYFSGRANEPHFEIASDLSLPNSLATLYCKVWKDYDGGDHHILVGEVENIKSQDGTPLLYFDRTYRRLDSSETNQ